MMLQNPKRRLWSIDQVGLPDIHLQQGRLGSGNIVEGESWSNGYLLYLPLTDTCAYSANGTVLPKNAFMILEPGCDFCLSTKLEHDWCTIFVPTHRFAHDDDLGEELADSERICRVTQGNLQMAKKFRSLVDQVITAAANYPQFESSSAARCAESELLKIASSIVGRPSAREPSKKKALHRLPRQEIIRRAKQHLEKSEGERIHVRELAAAAGVSERTLRSVFNECFGVGPVRYLQLRQLHQVRRVLKAAEPEAGAVRDILVQHGEWEFGRFATRYGQLFGELPSETLQRKWR